MLQQLKQLFLQAKTHKGFRRYFANTSWLFGEQILRIVAGLLIGVYVARYLGPEQFGLFNYALAFVALFGSFAKLGLDGIIIRDLVHAPEDRDIYLGTAFWLKLIGAVITGVVIIAVIALTESDPTTKLYIGIIAIGLIFQSFEVIDFYFQSQVLSKYVSICKISQLLLSSLLKLYFVLTKTELIWFVLLTVVDQVSFSVALSYAYSKQKLGAFYVCFDKAVAKKMLISAKPLIISGIMVSVYSSVDRVIIKEMLGVKDVGLYVAASGLTSALYFVPMLITNSLFPAILSAKQQSEKMYYMRLSLLYKYLLLFGFFICLFVTLFAAPIITLLYGKKFILSSYVLQIYIWNYLLISFSSVFGKWLLAENQQYVSPLLTFIGMLLNIITNIILIPLFAVKGAALAAVLSQLITFILTFIIYPHLNKHLLYLIKILRVEL